MSDVDTAIRLAMQTIEFGSNTTIQLATLLENICKSSKNPIDKAFAQQIKADNVAIVEMPAKDAKILQSLLQKDGIEACVRTVNHGRDENVKEQYTSYLMVKKDDVEKAQEVITRYNLLKEKGLTSIQNLEAISNGKEQSFSIVSPEVVQLYIKRAEEVGIPIAITKHDDYSIRFAKKDLGKMNKIRADISMDMSGKTGEYLKSQIKWMNENKKNICKEIQNEYKHNFVVVDAKSDVIIKVDKKGISVNGKLYTQGKELDSIIKRTIASYDNPTILSEKETGRELSYKQMLSKYNNMTEKDKSFYIIQRQRDYYQRPVPTPEEIEKMGQEKLAKEKVGVKLAQNNPEDKIEIVTPYNNEESTWGFIEKEKKNYEKVHDDSEIDKDVPVILNEAQQNFDLSTPRVQKDVDNIVYEKEEEIFDMEIDLDKLEKEINLEEISSEKDR